MQTSHVHAASDEDFATEVLAAEETVLVDFGATWCAPCRALSVIVEHLARELDGKFRFVAVDTDDAPEVARRYGVRSVPTVIVFRKGERRASHVGLTTRAKLLELLGA